MITDSKLKIEDQNLQHYIFQKGTPMDKNELEKRIKEFALEVIKFVGYFENLHSF